MTRLTMTPESFREHLPNLQSVRFTRMQHQNAREYAGYFETHQTPPWLYDLWEHWKVLYNEPFRGITNDGRLRTHLFPLQDEGVCVEPIVQAAKTLLGILTPHQLQKTLFHIDAPEWRSWSNPEFLLSDKGVRLDEVDTNIRNAILEILSLSFSARGYQKARDAMRINGFLGLLVRAPAVCNEFSYNFAIFGTPSRCKPWGWSFYGHHLCLNVFMYRNQIVVSPCFTGAEPNEIDEGEYSGTTILQREQDLGLELMFILPKQMQATAQIYELMKDAKMPTGRWNRDDQRHVCGAYRDNRVVPYEGVVVADMPVDAILLVEQILHEFLLYLPDKAREMKLAQVRQHYKETYFCWIGNFNADSAFYYRIQSPVVIVEFDHHSGVFLSNSEPARFHIHTLLRNPNGGDYGKALMPLIRGEEQAFVWKGDDAQKRRVALEGHQEE